MQYLYLIHLHIFKLNLSTRRSTFYANEIRIKDVIKRKSRSTFPREIVL